MDIIYNYVYNNDCSGKQFKSNCLDKLCSDPEKISWFIPAEGNNATEFFDGELHNLCKH